MWRHSETGAVVDLASFWVAGQPNGVRVQNCAGIWELVSSAAGQGRSSSYTARCGQDGAGSSRGGSGEPQRTEWTIAPRGREESPGR